MKKHHRIFIAIPFDAATRNQYYCIRDEIRSLYPNVTVVIASAEVGPSPTYSDIATFKAQNRDLHHQFTQQITDADLVIADLTHNNPNVHVELGIALTQNKNILRVSGRSVTELGFDIRNLEVFVYKTQADLLKKILEYVKIFFEIKALPFSSKFPELYCEEQVPIKLNARTKRNGLEIHRSKCPNLLIRDGAVQVDFSILSANGDTDWFGIFFRPDADQLVGSYLVYVRENGMVEIAMYPGPRVIAKSANAIPKARHSVLVEFDNNEVNVQVDNIEVVAVQHLSRQTPGRVLLAAYCSEVEIHSAQMICRDTIQWD